MKDKQGLVCFGCPCPISMRKENISIKWQWTQLDALFPRCQDYKHPWLLSQQEPTVIPFLITLQQINGSILLQNSTHFTASRTSAALGSVRLEYPFFRWLNGEDFSFVTEKRKWLGQYWINFQEPDVPKRLFPLRNPSEALPFRDCCCSECATWLSRDPLAARYTINFQLARWVDRMWQSRLVFCCFLASLLAK